MKSISLLFHAKGSPGLRLLGLGPNLMPCDGLKNLQKFMNKYAFWAKNRSIGQIRHMLKNSTVCVTAWSEGQIIGFGRANSDYVFRAVLWDVIVADEFQGEGVGQIIVNSLLNSYPIYEIEKVYLMTTYCSTFYEKFGFKHSPKQTLLVKENL